MSAAPDVLIAGAGPTGLTLALQAHDHGARVRIVDRREGLFRPSRALIMHPRTLEVLRPLGVTYEILERGNTDPRVELHLGGRVVTASLGTLALPDTAFPHLTLVRQMDVETALLHALTERGVEVERGIEVIDIRDGADEIEATLRSNHGEERVSSRYLAGCDGPESTVRLTAGLGWHGGPYDEEIMLADVELDTDLSRDVAHAAIGRDGLVILFALGEQAPWRLLATRKSGSEPSAFGQPGQPVPQEELQELLDDAGIVARIADVAWSARYRVQHRLASRFRRGRLFLAGDAAHAYSPATGQGMNTGIQDAINLGWKLAFAPTASDPVALLGSYDLERRPVARQVLAMTHLAFWFESSSSSIASLVRASAPLGAPVIPLALKQRRLIAEVMRWISQLRTRYQNSPIAAGESGRRPGSLRAGDRLPDATVETDLETAKLHALTATPGVHVLLHRDAPPLNNLRFGRYVTTHRVTSTPGTGMTAVRPDGYIGYLSDTADTERLLAWLDRIGARSGAR